jgi:hypothetical protein
VAAVKRAVRKAPAAPAGIIEQVKAAIAPPAAVTTVIEDIKSAVGLGEPAKS